MKYILLMRHAKSSHDDSRLKDFDRPLTDRGRRDAPLMGNIINDSGYKPGAIVSSPALRAKETTQLVARSLNIPDDGIIWNDELYYGSFEDYLKSLQQLPKSVETTLLVGHNPLIEETISALCSDGRDFVVRMPTSGLICMEHIADQWNQIRPETAHIKWMIIPEIVRKLF